MNHSPRRDAPATHPIRVAARLLTLSASLLEAAHAGEDLSSPANSLRVLEARALLVQLSAGEPVAA